jgi:[ribosomal protein S18]-alanine N-acetyltransferase
MKNLKLVQMTESHIPGVLAIERRVFDTPWTREMFLQEIRGVFGSHTTVALAEDRVIGYQIAWLIEDEVHLVNIAVDPDYQKHGVGTLLLNHLIEHARGQSKSFITLEVRASNAAAQAFYRRFLFRTIGVRRGYYSDNREDALLMVLDLARMPDRSQVGEGKSG